MRIKNLGFMNYPNYEVDDQGNVWSLDYNHTGERRKLKPIVGQDGYLRVVLCNNGKKKMWLVHQLVGFAFIGDWRMLGLTQFNHKNEDKTDNRVENLEPCDACYNNTYGTRLERLSKSLKGRHLSEEHKKKIGEAGKGRHHTEETRKKIGEAHKGKGTKEVNQYTLDGTFLQSFNSMNEASELTGINKGNICKCCKGKVKSAGGFIWRYA